MSSSIIKQIEKNLPNGLEYGRSGKYWNYVGKSPAHAQKIAAMVPVAAYLPEFYPDHRIDSTKAHHIASSNLPIWSFHNSGDPVSSLTYVINAHTTIANSDLPSNFQPI